MRVLILAAYLVAAILPVLALGEGRQQFQDDHAQMMAMAGHLAQMPGMGGADDVNSGSICSACAGTANHRMRRCTMMAR